MKKLLIGLLVLGSASSYAKDLFLNCLGESYEDGKLIEKNEVSSKMNRNTEGHYHIEAHAKTANSRFEFTIVAAKNPWQSSESRIGMRIDAYDTKKMVDTTFWAAQKKLEASQFDGRRSVHLQKSDGYRVVCDVGERKYSGVEY